MERRQQERAARALRLLIILNSRVQLKPAKNFSFSFAVADRFRVQANKIPLGNKRLIAHWICF